MARYYVNKNVQNNGQHEVHKQGCSYMPDEQNRKYLGDFSNCFSAVVEAKSHYDNVDGCYFCSRNCHTG